MIDLILDDVILRDVSYPLVELPSSVDVVGGNGKNTVLWQDNNDVNAMSNNNKYPTMVGNCCLTNAFDSGTCFGEALLRKDNGGAIGYIGGSDVTYWNDITQASGSEFEGSSHHNTALLSTGVSVSTVSSCGQLSSADHATQSSRRSRDSAWPMNS